MKPFNIIVKILSMNGLKFYFQKADSFGNFFRIYNRMI